MSLDDKQAIERSTDDHLGFGGSAKATDEAAGQDPQTEDDEASYVDSCTRSSRPRLSTRRKGHVRLPRRLPGAS